FTARSYGRILGANDRINVGVMGANNRGKGLTLDFANAGNTAITHVCDVDSRVLAMIGNELNRLKQPKAKMGDDIRRQLEDKDMDVLVIATPDHWHAAASIMALQAGKHVYVEKPCSHNPGEGELLVAAQKKYNHVVQMGNQQRSSLETIELMKAINDGELGDIYHVYTWYANNRPSIGKGSRVPVPEWLNWDLWQGPAPRADYSDIYVHYNWHWFWDWGTGE
ncbi:MAG: Gfo/Idh/MocA family oxidoreductase, partial [Muricauda sp.]|nr:Gfo/Idh/MocA family oxidoreductase [Allomuricauda sp.]